ncbi:hypothetical protein LXL04_011402 [Taraxacum kok-saghyz]
MDPEEPTNRSSSVSNLTRDSTFRSLSLSSTQSPPLQLMEREIPEDNEFQDVRNSSPSSNRCSSSSSSEWSSVSNESLFSIHISNSLTHDESLKSDDLTFSSPVDDEEIPSKLNEPQKCVRWKTQVERPVEEGAPPEGHQWQPSPFNTHVASEPANHDTSKQKKKLWWSWCKCGSCKWTCWKNMTCFNCTPKKVTSSHSTGASGPKKPPGSKKGGGSRSTRTRSWACSCHCCCDDANLLA